MKIDVSEVEHVAHLARLRVTDEEARRLTDQINNILTHMEQLNGLDTSDIEPMAHALSLETPFREDVARSSLDPEESLANAPEREGSFFLVPKVI
jgi:aspartyl-tRNA(Asn)/glutamyl-tRNA(Gln) amidotransferase subunit C